MEPKDRMDTLYILGKIVRCVVDDDSSPFNTMMRKAKDIDIDYFEKISRGTNRLSDQLNLGLRDLVIDAFEKMAATYYEESGLQKQLMTAVLQKAEQVEDKIVFLTMLAIGIELAADKEVPSQGLPRYTNADLDEKLRKAKEITLKEFFFGDNGKDILEFYNALMDNTWWACRALIARRTKKFLCDLSKELLKVAQNAADDKDEYEAICQRELEEVNSVLPDDLVVLAEQLAQRVHDVWAEERIRQGWSYGEKRDDVLKTHPCLVPYEDLPEEEKIYDRQTSQETLKFILKQGFKIHK